MRFQKASYAHGAFVARRIISHFGADPLRETTGKGFSVRRNIAVLLVLCSLLCCAPSVAAGLTYHVVSGDSLWTIAAQYGVSVQRLEAVNQLSDSSILQLGQRLIVPVAPELAPQRRSASGLVQKVRSVSRQIAAAASAQHVVGKGARRPLESAAQRIAAARALWSATHDGTLPPAIPGIEPFSVAQRIILMDSRITRTAMRFLGVPYTWGGTGFGGVDCSGLVYTVFARNGISLPRMADGQFEAGRRVAMSLLVPGDLVFFETYTSGASHVGIYIGNGRFIHASLRGVVIDELRMSYYASRYLGARRLIQ